MKTTEEIISIVRVGCDVIVDSSKTTDELISVVRVAGPDSRVIVKRAGRKSTDELISIARVGRGQVVLDLTG